MYKSADKHISSNGDSNNNNNSSSSSSGSSHIHITMVAQQCFLKYMCKKKRLLLRFALLTMTSFAILVMMFIYTSDSHNESREIAKLNIRMSDDFWLPDGGDNETAWPIDIVPNIVHYILFEHHKITYIHMLSLFSVCRIHRPQYIYIHCDCEKIDADDNPYWDRVLTYVNETNDITILIVPTERPTHINGIRIRNDFQNFHGSDITRYRLLRRYGGIYLDNDVLVCQPLHKFRRYEFTLNWDEGQSLGSQVLIGHRNARFLKFVLESYKMYDTNRWYYNAAELPTRAILERYPQIVHRIKVKFGVDAPVACQYFYMEYHDDWQNEYYTFHMVARGNSIQWGDWCFGFDDYYMKHVIFNDDTIEAMNNTFAEVARYALYGRKTAATDAVHKITFI